MDKIKLLNTFEKYTIIVTIFLYPLIVLATFTNVFETPKLLLLSTSVFLILLIKIAKSIIKKSYELNIGKFDFFAATLAVTYLLSGLIASPNKVDSFFLPGTASFVILSSIFYFLINQLNKEDKKEAINSLIFSVFIMAMIQIMSFFGITKIIPFLPEFVKVNVFNTFGNTINSIVVLAATAPFLIEKLVKKVDISEKILSGLVLLVFIISMGTSIYLTLPNKETSVKILDPKIGWAISLDSMKTNPILGTGPANFIYAFNKFRPITFNSKEDWNLKYLQGSSMSMTIFTETGILGLLSILLLLLLVFRSLSTANMGFASLSIFLIGIIFLPISFSSIFIFFILLAVYTDTKSLKLGYFVNKIPQMFIAMPIILLLVAAIYLSTRAFYAEYLFSKSISKLNKNEGIAAYENVNKAVQVSPYTDRYHMFSAAINIALAESLAKKTDINDEDRKNISQLIQQSIREGKAAVAVNRFKSSNWEALSGVYQTIIAFAQGADNFALESLDQAVVLDPINPILRIKQGNLYFSLKKYDLAIESLKLAVLAKPDLANAHYNLAIVYKENKQLDKAKEELNATLSLVGKDSNSADYEKTLKELQNIEELSKPEALPEPAIEPQIELPQDTTSEVQQ